jgi:hypothetical protein
MGKWTKIKSTINTQGFYQGIVVSRGRFLAGYEHEYQPADARQKVGADAPAFRDTIDVGDSDVVCLASLRVFNKDNDKADVVAFVSSDTYVFAPRTRFSVPL